MTAVLNLPQAQTLVSDDHFSFDGTLIKAWAKLARLRLRSRWNATRRQHKKASARGYDEPPVPGRNGTWNLYKETWLNETPVLLVETESV